MKKSNQHHHPKKGDKITVAPIRKIEDIKSISKLLSDAPRTLLNGSSVKALTLKKQETRTLAGLDLILARNNSLPSPRIQRF